MSTKPKKENKIPLEENGIAEEPLENEDCKPSNEIENLTKELDIQKDRLLRTAAEYENFRKRTEKEKASIYTDAISMAVSAILPIADSLEQANKSLGEKNQNYKKGILLILEQFNESMKKLNVEAFGEKGDIFNPDLHNAVSHTEDENSEENVIFEVFQKGYKIGDRIVRYAMVQVAN